MPPDWTEEGVPLSDDTIVLSPEDRRTNEDWANAHQDLIQHEEGDAPLGPNAHSLRFSYLYNPMSELNLPSNSLYHEKIKDEQDLSEMFATGIFSEKNSNPALLKRMKIGGRDAYEIAWTVNPPGVGPITNHSILLGEKNVMVIEIPTEYDKLPEATKAVLGSVSFEK